MQPLRASLGTLLGASLLLLAAQVGGAHAEQTFEESVRDAQAIFVGTLTRTTPRWGNPSRTWLETEYEFLVDDVLLADDHVRSGKAITITRWGGKLGAKHQALAGEPTLTKGGRYVLLLNEKYRDPECRQPLVGPSDGLLAVIKSDGVEMVVDHRGDPLLLLDGDRLARYGELAGRKVAAEPVSATQFAKALKSDLARVRSLPKVNQPALARVTTAKSQHRPLAKLGSRPNISGLPKALPKSAVIKGVHEPTPNSRRITAHLANAKAVVGHAAPRTLGVKFTGEVAKLPLAFNQFPPNFPMAGIDVDCMILWNHYFPETFHIYREPLDDVGFGNGVSDVWGFVTDDELQDIAGRRFEGSAFFVFWWVNVDSGRIEEADIFFSAHCDWTLDDAAIYNNADNRVSFRRMMMQALGMSVGLSESGALAVMSPASPYCFQGINQPQADDLWGLDTLYPRNFNGHADLLLTLASSPRPNEWVEASFSPNAVVGGEITIGGYSLCNVGVGACAEPKVDWYLCTAQNWDDRYIHLGSTTYPRLDRGGWFFVDEGIDRTLAVPQDTPPGAYFLGAFVPGEANFSVRGFFPLSNDSAFSRSKITITRD